MMTPSITVTKVKIYKDNWIASKPWCADLIWSDGQVWTKFVYQFKTLTSLKARLAEVPTLSDVEIVRG